MVGSDERPAAEEAGVLKPLPFLPSLLYSGLPALLMAVGFYWVMPALLEAGWLP